MGGLTLRPIHPLARSVSQRPALPAELMMIRSLFLAGFALSITACAAAGGDTNALGTAATPGAGSTPASGAVPGAGNTPGTGATTGVGGTAATGSVPGTGGAVGVGGAAAWVPPAACTTPPAPVAPVGQQHGFGSRYWDCCKPSCSWTEKVDAKLPTNRTRACSIGNAPAVLDVNKYTEAPSGCGTDAANALYTCYDMNPWAPCATLSYGFAAVPAAGPPSCGKCFQLDFDGKSREQQNNPKYVDVGSQGLLGKTMIVLATNTGGDVGSGQFDLMIPGGGLGIYKDGCKRQWKVEPTNTALLGKDMGGFRALCDEKLGWDASQKPENHGQILACVRGMCSALFGADPAKADLLKGCMWYVEWFGAANNPTFNYKEVLCPAELKAKY